MPRTPLADAVQRIAQDTAITRRYGRTEPLLMALEAGVDLLLQPMDAREAVDAVVAGVQSGRITEARLDASVRRILEAKARAGLHRSARVDLEAWKGFLAAPRRGEGPVVAASVQPLASSSQVAPVIAVPTRPPNNTVRARWMSYAAAARMAGCGPGVCAADHADPEYSQVSDWMPPAEWPMATTIRPRARS